MVRNALDTDIAWQLILDGALANTPTGNGDRHRHRQHCHRIAQRNPEPAGGEPPAPSACDGPSGGGVLPAAGQPGWISASGARDGRPAPRVTEPAGLHTS